MKKVIGTTDFLAKKYDTFDLSDVWKQHIGMPEKGFSMNISGYSTHGKTNYTIMLVKAFAKAGVRIDYNSYEEGHGSSLQTALIRHNMSEVAGKVMWLNRYTYDELVERLSRRNSAQMCVIDSGDDMELTYKMYQALRKQFPRKSFIIVTKGDKRTGEPIWSQSSKIRFKCDIKVIVKNFIAIPGSRFGGNESMLIRERKPEGQQKMELA